MTTMMITTMIWRVVRDNTEYGIRNKMKQGGVNGVNAQV